MNLRLAAIFFLLALAPALFAGVLPGRYIVELSTEPVAEHVTRTKARSGLRSAQARDHRARVLAEQDEVRGRLEERHARVLDGTNTVANTLFVEIADEAAANLATIPGVKRVLPVRTFHMVLDRALLLHKVFEARSQIGGGRAGEGVKVAIIDSGIETGHPGFQDPALPTPDTFPRADTRTDLALTSNKVIVARSYVYLLPYRDPDYSAWDHIGHGTALAMIAAGVRNAGPLAVIEGVAPKAYVGNYKVFGTPGYNDGSTDDAILKAIDDAVADGMDIINLSLGDDLAPRLEDDLEVQAVERAVKAGVIVVAAAGNNGPDLNTMSSPATAPSVIAVGATSNDRTFSTSVDIPGFAMFLAVTGSGPVPAAPVTGRIVDAASLDGDGLACSALPAGSLAGGIALILRGTCSFEAKLINAQRAGAAAALVYATESSPDPFRMGTGAATLPAEMISFAAGAAIKEALAKQEALYGTLIFTAGTVPVAPNRLTDFSAAGPNADKSIKPDLVAVGGDVYTATQTVDPRGDMYNSSGFILADGTSFSSPLVAGAAALLRSARPGLTVDQYRSLLINSAAAAETRSGSPATVQQTGAGLLNVLAAVNSTVTAYPTSLGLGAGGTDPRRNRVVTITNVGQNAETYTIGSTSRSAFFTPVFESSTIELAPGTSAQLAVAWSGEGLAPGAYEGFIEVTGAASGSLARIPYWYAVESDSPAKVTVINSISSARRGSVQGDAVLFRVTDSAGLALTDAQIEVTAVSGGGSVLGLVNHDREVPGVYGIRVQMGPNAATNVFRVRAGEAVTEVSIAGQ